MKRRRVSWQHRLEYIGWKLTAAFLVLLPRRATVMLADLCGLLLFDGLHIRRKLVETNLAIAFGSTHSEQERKQIARKCYQNQVLTFFEFVCPKTVWMSLPELFLPHEGQSHFDEVRERPAIVILGHIGNWESMAYVAVAEGLKFAAFAKPLHNPLINDAVLQQRLASGIDITSSDSSLKASIDMARHGVWLGFLGDQDARRRGIFVDFFGKPASTAEGAAFFSHKLQLPILPAFSIRENDSLRRLRVHFAPAIYPDPNSGKEDDVRRLTEAHVKALEEIIRKHPADYFWLHNRWKTSPKVRRNPESH